MVVAESTTAPYKSSMKLRNLPKKVLKALLLVQVSVVDNGFEMKTIRIVSSALSITHTSNWHCIIFLIWPKLCNILLLCSDPPEECDKGKLTCSNTCILRTKLTMLQCSSAQCLSNSYTTSCNNLTITQSDGYSCAVRSQGESPPTQCTDNSIMFMFSL